MCTRRKFWNIFNRWLEFRELNELLFVTTLHFTAAAFYFFIHALFDCFRPYIKGKIGFPSQGQSEMAGLIALEGDLHNSVSGFMNLKGTFVVQWQSARL